MPSSPLPFPIAISPCPNDTIAFHAWVHGRVKGEPIKPHYADIQHLNEWALEGRYPLIKLSFACLGQILDDYALLPVGSALGHGCGPLLISKQSYTPDDLSRLKVAVPGRNTTAYLLLRTVLPAPAEVRFCLYDEVVPLILAGEVDAGLVIHETRFTYQDAGLVSIADVGTLWEQQHHAAIPLGGIAIKRELGKERIHTLTRTLQRSLQYAWDHPQESLKYILEHSIEKDEQVVHKHIDLYVNEETMCLSEKAIHAVDHLLTVSRQRGILPTNHHDWLACRELCTTTPV